MLYEVITAGERLRSPTYRYGLGMATSPDYPVLKAKLITLNDKAKVFAKANQSWATLPLMFG